MNKKQDMVEKDSFRQAGEDLLRKVREEERVDSRLALSSWQKLEERLNAPRKTSVLRIRYLVSSVAAAVMLLLAVGCYFWMMGHDKSSLPLALLEEKNVGALPGDEMLCAVRSRARRCGRGRVISQETVLPGREKGETCE